MHYYLRFYHIVNPFSSPYATYLCHSVTSLMLSSPSHAGSWPEQPGCHPCHLDSPAAWSALTRPLPRSKLVRWLGNRARHTGLDGPRRNGEALIPPSGWPLPYREAYNQGWQGFPQPAALPGTSPAHPDEGLAIVVEDEAGIAVAFSRSPAIRASQGDYWPPRHSQMARIRVGF